MRRIAAFIAGFAVAVFAVEVFAALEADEGFADGLAHQRRQRCSHPATLDRRLLSKRLVRP
jgi:hypothetical protein